MKLVINRDKWLRGEGAFESKLLRREDGKMCCLGFLGLACGLSESDIMGKATPVDALNDGKYPEAILEYGFLTTTSYSLMSANDSRYIPETEREQTITNLMSEIGIEVEFK